MKAQTHIVVIDNYSYIEEENNPIFLEQIKKSIDPLEKTLCILIDHTNDNSLRSNIQSLSLTAECISLNPIYFFGFLNTKFTARRLKKIFLNYSMHRITAHGVIASALIRQCIDPLMCNNIALKIYGLISAEHDWQMHNKKKSFFYWLHTFKQWHYQSLEKKVFTQKYSGIKLSIETISSALKEFIFNSYHCEFQTMNVMESSLNYFEKNIDNSNKNLRNELNIASDAIIYCLDASKNSVDIGLGIALFKKELIFVHSAYLLIVSSDQKIHEIMLSNALSSAYYQVINNVQFKSAYYKIVDIGLIVRDHHIAHWVSKPSDALFYDSAHIPMIHNNTIAWLAKEYETKEFYSPDVMYSQKQNNQHASQ